jgi:hypothetical protein
MERKATHKASEKSIVDIALDHGHRTQIRSAQDLRLIPNDRSGLEIGLLKVCEARSEVKKRSSLESRRYVTKTASCASHWPRNFGQGVHVRLPVSGLARGRRHFN